MNELQIMVNGVAVKIQLFGKTSAEVIEQLAGVDQQELLAHLQTLDFVKDNTSLSNLLKDEAVKDPADIALPHADIAKAMFQHAGVVPEELKTPADKDDGIDWAELFIANPDAKNPPKSKLVEAKLTTLRKDKAGNGRATFLTDGGSSVETTLYPNYFKEAKNLFNGKNDKGEALFTKNGSIMELNEGAEEFYQIAVQEVKGYAKHQKSATTYRVRKPLASNTSEKAQDRWKKTFALLKETFPADWENYYHKDSKFGDFVLIYHRDDAHENMTRINDKSNMTRFNEQYETYLEAKKASIKAKESFELIGDFMNEIVGNGITEDKLLAFKLGSNVALGKGFDI